MVTICISHLELPENNWKYFEKFCNPFAVVTIYCMHTMYFNVTLRLIFQNRVTFVLWQNCHKKMLWTIIHAYVVIARSKVWNTHSWYPSNHANLKKCGCYDTFGRTIQLNFQSWWLANCTVHNIYIYQLGFGLWLLGLDLVLHSFLWYWMF